MRRNEAALSQESFYVRGVQLVEVQVVDALEAALNAVVVGLFQKSFQVVSLPLQLDFLYK